MRKILQNLFKGKQKSYDKYLKKQIKQANEECKQYKSFFEATKKKI